LNTHSRLRSFIEHPRTQHVIIGLILVNAALLGLATWPAAMERYGPWIDGIDRAILMVFVVEIALRLYLERSRFWRDPWSVFDFTVVAIALAPATGQFAVLRALRVLRVLRLLTMVPSMRRVVGALLAAVPGLMSIVLVLAIIYYVFAVIATKLFASAFPDWFGTLGRSFYSLFQVMTLESWSMGIARPVMQVYPLAWLFFVPFILIATFTMLNLFIAVIVSAMQDFSEHEKQETVQAVEQSVAETGVRIEAGLHADLQSLRAEIRELKALLGQKGA
jgi:voltage-gated sodium channel